MITGYYKDLQVEGGRLEKALAWLQAEDWKTLPAGRYDIDGDDVYANISEYTTKEPENGRFEKHIVYIDVQMMIEGKELCYVTQDSSICGNAEGPYNEANDITFYDGSKKGSHKVIMTPGNVAVLFPNDAHMPAVAYDKASPVKKVVIKVRY